MRRKRILRAVLDGVANWLLLTGVTICSLAEKTTWIPLAWMTVLSALAAALSSVCYWLLLKKEDGRKARLCFTLESILSFFVCAALYLICLISKTWFPFQRIPLRETNAADGIVLLFLWRCFLLISVIAKICVFAAVDTENGRKER